MHISIEILLSISIILPSAYSLLAMLAQATKLSNFLVASAPSPSQDIFQMMRSALIGAMVRAMATRK